MFTYFAAVSVLKYVAQPKPRRTMECKAEK